MQGNEKAMDMENWQGMQQHIPLCKAPMLMQRPGVGSEVVMGQHCALGPSRGARRIENGSEIIASARNCL